MLYPIELLARMYTSLIVAGKRSQGE
jgi:hypothetical protein